MRKDKKRIHILGFISGLLILIVIVSTLFDNGENVYDAAAVKSKTEEIRKEADNSIEVLFLGDSLCYSSFYPVYLWQEQGYTSYVCGTSAQRICDTYLILKNAFKTQSPKLVVLETNCIYRKLDNGKNGDEIMNWLIKKIPVFKNHSLWKNFTKNIEIKYNQRKEEGQKGFKLRKAVIPYTGGEYMCKTDACKKIPELSGEYLKKIADLCRENNTELILVSTLSPKNWNYEKHNGVQQWAADNGISYLDMNMENCIKIDWDCDTKDGGDHLNLEGAKKVTSYIGNYLKENYHLTDYREESSYLTWDKP